MTPARAPALIKPARGAAEAGFTLIELLVALTLVGLLATLLVGGVRLAAGVWTRAGDRAAETADLWAVDKVLRQAIGAAHAGVGSGAAGETAVPFEGRADTLALVAPLPEAIASGVPGRMRFYLETEAGGGALFVAWRLDPGGAASPERRTRLLDRVRGVRFEYFGPGETDGRPAWQPHWLARARLPDLVRIRVERDGSSPPWPDLIAEPRAAAALHCGGGPLGGCAVLR